MNTAGNVIWLLFGGLVSAIGYFAGGFILCCTIIGIPFGMQCFKLGMFVLWPFGKTAIGTQASSGCLVLLLNIIWILRRPFAGYRPYHFRTAVFYYDHWHSLR
jgi:uncharacterized membrane protein YccF (DUF307 family)